LIDSSNARELWTIIQQRIFYKRGPHISALEVCYENALYKFTFDILTHQSCAVICVISLTNMNMI